MADKSINEILKYLYSKLETIFIKILDNNNIVLVSENIILKDINKDIITMHLKSNIFPDDAATIALNIKDMVDEFGYKDLKIGEIFDFDNKVLYGKNAIEKFQKQQYRNIKEKVVYDMFLDLKLNELQGFNC